jgi:hypothetical protein
MRGEFLGVLRELIRELPREGLGGLPLKTAFDAEPRFHLHAA